ncbi:unnamed protein product [Bursaphelenchus okinawaensis]|uniref:Uncharacterized protein n=1 Tax=Bursaphelenchus okinawaensis TaxID=465554 RepID=A0A811JWQ0_9BILA|nr:unnamed protein product [Bursaphelenchus okinawaensis]CAG9086462.1 unnamed protein product [Bursaphelenchus okinawaensis]
MNLKLISSQRLVAGVLLVLLIVLPCIPSAPADPIAELFSSLNEHEQRKLTTTTLSNKSSNDSPPFDALLVLLAVLPCIPSALADHLANNHKIVSSTGTEKIDYPLFSPQSPTYILTFSGGEHIVVHTRCLMPCLYWQFNRVLLLRKIKADQTGNGNR